MDNGPTLAVQRVPKPAKAVPQLRYRSGPPLINPDIIQRMLLAVKGISHADRYAMAVLFVRALYLNGQEVTDFLKPFEMPPKEAA